MPKAGVQVAGRGLSGEAGVSKKRIGLIGLFVGILAMLATLAVPFLERWLDQRAIGIQVVEPIRLSLLDPANSRGGGAEFVTVVLIQNRGRETLDNINIPIEFSGLRNRPLERFNISTQPSFEVRPIQNQGSPLALSMAYLNPGDAINFHLISDVNPGELIEPRIRGVKVSISKTSLSREGNGAWLSMFAPILAIFGMLVAFYFGKVDERGDVAIRDSEAALRKLEQSVTNLNDALKGKGREKNADH